MTKGIPKIYEYVKPIFTSKFIENLLVCPRLVLKLKNYEALCKWKRYSEVLIKNKLANIILYLFMTFCNVFAI